MIHTTAIRKIFSLALIAIAISAASEGYGMKQDEPAQAPLKIWFKEPAELWRQALPVGNGSLGAMVFGGVKTERLQLNEETVWTGRKLYDRDKKEGYKHLDTIRQLLFEGKYAKAEEITHEKLMAERFPTGTHTYQMLGNLFLDFDDGSDISGYHRELDLNNSVVRINYTRDDTRFRREIFSSYPDQVLVARISSDQKGKISFRLRVERSENTEIEISDSEIRFREHVGNGNGVKFESIIKVDAGGGKIEKKRKSLQISNADDVTIKIVAASDYRGDAPEILCERRLKAIEGYSYHKLLKRHVSDYRSLFDRVAFRISDSNGNDKPTPERLADVVEGEEDQYLTQLQYQFGRYLLISSSRPGSMPANLQGIWADGFKPPWNSDYHININIQMNYWLSELTNLSECHLPFLEFIGNLREMGRLTAKETYGCRGFVAHHTTDVWFPTSCFGRAVYGMWPLGAAWSCQHLFMHYEFTEDKKWLKDYAYPVMREAALFFVDFLVKDPKTGLLVSGPSISPENRFRTRDGKISALNMGPTMDRAIISELFTNCIKASEILDTDEEFRQILKNRRDIIPPLNIGKDGRLMEWVEEFDEPEPGHRHISHLYALHPSNQITRQKTPGLFEAAKKSLEYRLSHGGGHTGWSRAWIINFWARLLEADEAYENILALQRKSTLPNLFDNHPPFQIDGNFGVVSGITEMLLQSHAGEIHVLPALPSKWQKGEIAGLTTRKGFVVDIKWEDGKAREIKVLSRLGNNLKIRYGDNITDIPTKKGEVILLNSKLEKVNG